jgi:two-component sensor histidine kinase
VSNDESQSTGVRNRLARELRLRPERTPLEELAIGVAVALLAVALRYALPLKPEQLPTITIVVALPIVTTFVGMWAGIATALVGGLLCWFLFLNAYSWSLANEAWIPLIGFSVIATAIITTAKLYRSSERLRFEADSAKLKAEAEDAELFAREMAHRLKNALTIVQSIAFQTIGTESADAGKFAGRLRALADANELLNEHIRKPTAPVSAVVESALAPFRDEHARFQIESVDATIPAQQVVSLALAIHELGTNAVKYGSLSAPGGSVAIRIEELGEGLELSWKEQGGAPVSEPQRSGFGTRLLRRSSANTRLLFEPDGLRCTMSIRKA